MSTESEHQDRRVADELRIYMEYGKEAMKRMSDSIDKIDAELKISVKEIESKIDAMANTRLRQLEIELAVVRTKVGLAAGVISFIVSVISAVVVSFLTRK